MGVFADLTKGNRHPHAPNMCLVGIFLDSSTLAKRLFPQIARSKLERLHGGSLPLAWPLPPRFRYAVSSGGGDLEVSLTSLETEALQRLLYNTM